MWSECWVLFDFNDLNTSFTMCKFIFKKIAHIWFDLINHHRHLITSSNFRFLYKYVQVKTYIWNTKYGIKLVLPPFSITLLWSLVNFCSLWNLLHWRQFVVFLHWRSTAIFSHAVAIWFQVINKILKNVHHVWWDIVKCDGMITAALRALK